MPVAEHITIEIVSATEPRPGHEPISSCEANSAHSTAYLAARNMRAISTTTEIARTKMIASKVCSAEMGSAKVCATKIPAAEMGSAKMGSATTADHGR